MYSVPNYVEVSENKSIVKVFTVVGSQIMLISSLAFSGGGSTPYNLLENNMPHIYEMPVSCIQWKSSVSRLCAAE